MEKKRQESWFRRQISGLKGKDNRPREGAFEAAVAAAAFAIQSVEESKTPNYKTRNGRLPNSNRVIRQFSHKKTNNSGETSNWKSMEQNKEGKRVSWTEKLKLKSSLKAAKSVDSSKKDGW
ncbi:hypothetical protein SLEP1_g43819 [Rubroshorea leprosula]|uniref:Uncharacterized protein n=1 Tax=Rubroshorea leprosula TaxID=152421 RepID=A0AAV5LE76_9ROSI|nr:hypothetical protein SLEP1_g43819 [Rubroshorea leprosula]